MVTITGFENILTWQKAKILTVKIYTLLSSNKDYGFKDQIQRASVSIMNNIAEGYERKGNKQLIQYLYIAKGSCAEVRSLLILGLELGYITKQQYNECIAISLEVSKMLSGFIKKLGN